MKYKILKNLQFYYQENVIVVQINEKYLTNREHIFDVEESEQYFVDVEEILTKDGKLEIVYHRPNGYTPLLELKEYADFYKLDIVNRLPFIIANDTNIELSTFVTTILKHPINTFLEIIQSTYMIPFFIVQIIVLIVLFVFLHPTKRQPFEVVGKTNPVHGSAYWGEESEINAPKNVHLIPEKSMKKILEKSMRRGKND